MIDNEILAQITYGQITIRNTAYNQTGVCTFQVNDAPANINIQLEDEVKLTYGSDILYHGYIRSIRKASYPRGGHVVYDVECQDVSTLPNDDVCDVNAARDFVFETDKDRITWLFSTFGSKGITVGSNVQVLRSTMPFQDFTAKTLAEALDDICDLTGASWYVDYNLDLHYFISETNIAPYAFSDNPDNILSVGYNSLLLPSDSIDLKNAVFVKGATLSQWYQDDTSIATYGRREAAISDDRVTLQETLDAYGARFLQEHAYPRAEGSLVTYTYGFRAGQTMFLTAADHGLSGAQYRITEITTEYSFGDQHPIYKVSFGDPKISLIHVIRGTSSSVVTDAISIPADIDAPSVPEGVNAVGGFRGVGLSWNPSNANDIMFYQVRYGTDGSTWPTYITVRSTTIWIPDLDPDLTYSFEVRAVDQNGNVATSSTDPTAVPYLVNGEAGWSDVVSAQPSIIGSADIAANSVTAAMIDAAGISADQITAGTLNVAPEGGAITSPEAINVYDVNGNLLGTWNPDTGITIYNATDPSDYAVLDDGYLRFFSDGIEVATIGPEGVVADSISTGVLQGGMNLLLNSSFEQSAFVSVSTTQTFTDNTGTPGWKTANRTTTPDNITESTTLSVTSLAY